MAAKRLTIADLFKVATVTSIRLNAPGTAAIVAVRTPNVEKQRNESALWLWRRGADSLRRLTNGPADSMADWLDEETVLFAARDRDLDGEKSDKPYGKSRLYTMSLTGGEPRLRSVIDGIVWAMVPSPDGARIALSYSPNPKHTPQQAAVWEKAPKPIVPTRLRWKLDGLGILPDSLPGVAVLSTKGESWKAPQVLVSDPVYSYGRIRWTPDSQRLVASRENPDLKHHASDLCLIDLKGKLRVLEAPKASLTAFAISPDGRQLAFCANEDVVRGGYLGAFLGVRSLDPADTAWRKLLDTGGKLGMQNTLGDICQAGDDLLVWKEAGAVHVVDGSRGESRLLRVDVSTGEAQPVGGLGGVVPAFDAAGDTVLYFEATPNQPGEVFRAGRAKPISNFNKAVAPRFDVPVTRHIVETENDVEVEAFLYATPAQLRNKKRHALPLVVYIHGGPTVQTGMAPFHHHMLMAHEGFPLVTLNPRGSTGYGDEHGAAIYGNWGDRDAHDVLAVRQAILDLYPQFDPARTFIMGGSYGGFMTNWMITRHAGVFRAAITDRCVLDYLSFVGTSDFSNYFAKPAFGLDCVFENPMHAWERSPIAGLKNVTEPLLIIHSDSDLRCPQGQAEELFVGLVELGKRIGEDVRFVLFRGESHGLSRGGKPENRRVRLEENLAWLRKHNTPRGVPAGKATKSTRRSPKK